MRTCIQKARGKWLGVSLAAVAWGSSTVALALEASAEGLYSSLDSPPVLKLISRARKTLDIEIYTMKHPKVLEAIRGALKRKVRVRIIKDPTPFRDDCPLFPVEAPESGSDPKEELAPKDPANCADQRKLVAEVNAASAQGSAFVPFAKSELCKNPAYYCFEHGKLALADQSVALLSTGNFDPSNLCTVKDDKRCNRDYSYVTRDRQLVASLSTIFEKDFLGKRYDLLSMIKSGEIDRRLVVSPYSEIPLVDLIDSARSEILLQNQYLRQNSINDALIRAAQRGVKVRVNISSFCAFERPDAKAIEQATRTYEAFDKAGIETRVFTAEQKIKGHPGYLHAKAILVDGARAWVGSVNGSMTSVINNREFGLLFEDAESIATLSTFLKHDLEDKRSESWRESTVCAKDPQPEPESPEGNR